MLNLETDIYYNVHPLHCPFCDEKKLYSHKGYRYTERTDYDCNKCGYVFTGFSTTEIYVNTETKQRFYSIKRSIKKKDYWVFKIDRRKE